MQMRRPRILRQPLRAAVRLLLVCGCLACIAASASAVVFTVTLTNGTTFETRERPVIAEWDENYVLLRTDQGNWISLEKAEVADVSTAAEASGFGYQVDATTLYVGFTPGDIEFEDGEDGQGGEGGAAPAPPDDSPITYGGSTGSYGLSEFLDIPQTGTISSQPLPGETGDQ